jgi:hypothetical protein
MPDTTFVLHWRPPGFSFANGYERSPRRFQTTQSLLTDRQLICLGASGIANVTRDFPQNPLGFL